MSSEKRPFSFSDLVSYFINFIRTGNPNGEELPDWPANADAISSCFIGQLTAGVIFSPFCFHETDFSFPVIAAVTGLGVIQVGLAYILFTIGIRHMPPERENC